MSAEGFAPFDVTSTLWVSVGVGAVVTALVIGSAVIYERRRTRRPDLLDAPPEVPSPQQDLLRLLETGECNPSPTRIQCERTTEEEFDQMMAAMLEIGDANPLELPEDREFLDVGGDERRASRRRWGNPTEVRLRSDVWCELHGLVVNRSTGGLGIYADRDLPQGSQIDVRATAAPAHIPSVRVEVRHCLKVGKGFILGCKFSEEVPWNARAWFG